MFVHAFLDGRDTPPKSAQGFLEKFLADIAGLAGRAPGDACRGAITRWTATSAGTGWRNAYDALVDAKAGASTMPSRRWTHPMPKTSPTNSCCPACWAIMPACRMAMRCCSPISAPTGRGRFPPALLDKGFEGFERSRVVQFQRRGGPDRIFRSAEAADGARCSRRKMCARRWAK